MGYRISTIANLPIIPDMKLYVFVLGERCWEGGFSSIIEKNFAKLAKNLGRNAMLVMAHEGIDLGHELIDAVKDRYNLKELIDKAEGGTGGILILGAHPDRIGNDDLILYSPFKSIEEKFSNTDQYFNELCDFATGKNLEFLDRFNEKTGQSLQVLDMIDLKPNFMGIGLNINKALEKLLN
jgi:hypothetical protein